MKTVLIVDDEQSIRTLANYALSRAGFELIEVGNAREANAQFLLENLKFVPDLI